MLSLKMIRFYVAIIAAIQVFAPQIGHAADATIPTAMDFARKPAISEVSISRDGAHIAALTSADGVKATVSIWKTSNLTAGGDPFVIALDKVDILGVNFIKNDRLVITTIQPFTYGASKVHLIKVWITDLEGKNFRPLLPEGRGRAETERFQDALSSAGIISTLPLDPQNVLMVDTRLATRGDVLKVNVYSGAIERVERGSDRFGELQSDLNGEVRARQELGFDKGAVYLAQWIRHPETKVWEEHFRWYAKDREPISIVGFTPDPNIIYIQSTKGRDKSGLYVYDIRQRKILEPLFEHKVFDALRPLLSTDKADYGEPLGFAYAGSGAEVYWTDPRLAAVNKAVQIALKSVPTAVSWSDPASNETARLSIFADARVDIIGWSEDRNALIVERSGPSAPPEYYLFNSSGTLNLLGRARPQIDPAALGTTRLVQYAARDGLMVPAILTTPPKAVFGEGPYPTLIEPHGGPWARDYLEWDSAGWVQYFASRGYAILQPQFRGSEGWGQKLWRAGDGEWGQKMQDDKDDGVKWLIDQKTAAPDRVAMFGYSYGGYAALAAAIRPNGLYQCAISGAGAGDLAKIKEETYSNRFGREFQNPTIQGMDPLARATEAQIPLFIYHGDRDTIVDVGQSRRFVDKLKAAGKPHRFLEIKDAGHQLITMTPAMLELQLVEIESYLKTECGPNGL
jgi:acetyl esterase/lipase